MRAQTRKELSISANLEAVRLASGCSHTSSTPGWQEEVSAPTLLCGAVGSHGSLSHHTVSLAALTHHAHGLLSLIVLTPNLG